MSFSWRDRQAAFESLDRNPPELLVIGGGVVGCSVAAHASRFGLNVALLEREDLACGASGSSTGLAHAGLRYLAQGRLLYVFHESRERHRLQDLAPHWVRPFHFVLPVYQNDPYPFWMVRFGTWIYDLFSWADALRSKRRLARGHRVLSAEDVKAKIPGIRSEGLVGGLEYYVDARLLDARFTLGYAQQAAQHGARVLTHCEAVSAAVSVEASPQMACRDRLTGHTVEFKPNLVINATGAWIDGVRQIAGLSAPIVQKSKGIHLIVDHVADSPLILSTPVKAKVFFVIPLDAESSIVGTTDAPIDQSPEEVAADPRDIQELLQQLFYFFPYLKQGPNLLEAIEAYKQVHVRAVTWGVRPLLRQPGRHTTGARQLPVGSTLHASREHRLVKDLPRFWSIPGVKLTAARAAGFEAAEEAWKTLRSGVPLPGVTWDPLPGGDMRDYSRFVTDAQRRFRLGTQSDDILAHLVSMYGTRYVEVLQWAQREPHYSERVLPNQPWILAEAAYAVHEEMVLTLNDFLWRRSKWALLRDLPEDVVRKIARVLGSLLEWSEERTRSEMEAYKAELKKHRL